MIVSDDVDGVRGCLKVCFRELEDTARRAADLGRGACGACTVVTVVAYVDERSCDGVAARASIVSCASRMS